MANCILYVKGTDEVVHYIENCVQTGRDFVGSNAIIRGAKESAYDAKWTDEILKADIISETQKIYTKKQLDVKSALLFQDVAISSASDVVVVVERKIRELYSQEQELRILRRRAIGDKNYQADYETKIKTLMTAGEDFIKSNSL